MVRRPKVARSRQVRPERRSLGSIRKLRETWKMPWEAASQAVDREFETPRPLTIDKQS